MIHLPNLKHISDEDIADILERAHKIKRNPRDYTSLLPQQTLGMLFQKTSTRTRVSFEAGMTELGGYAIFIDWNASNFVLTDVAYEIEYMSRNVDCIMARLLHHEDIQTIVAASQVPVINGCCEKYHPCQALTDLFTIQEYTDKPLDQVTLVYAGVQNNVSNSLTLICERLGTQLILATPDPDPQGESADADVQNAIQSSSNIEHTTDVNSAVREADFVYTDTWIDMQYFNDTSRTAENKATLEKMLPYQLNETLLEGRSCKIMHDMPIHADFEISPGLVRDPRSVIFEQAANRKHAQKGLLWWLFEQADQLIQ